MNTITIDWLVVIDEITKKSACMVPFEDIELIAQAEEQETSAVTLASNMFTWTQVNQ